MTNEIESCIYHDLCGSDESYNATMCSDCLSLARKKDKLGAYKTESLFAFTQQVYEQYDEPQDVMAALYDKGARQFVNEVIGVE